LSIPFLLALIFLKPVLGWFGNSDPSAKTLAGLATLLTLRVGFVVVGAAWMTLKRLGRDTGFVDIFAGLVFAVGPALAVYFLYPS